MKLVIKPVNLWQNLEFLVYPVGRLRSKRVLVPMQILCRVNFRFFRNGVCFLWATTNASICKPLEIAFSFLSQIRVRYHFFRINDVGLGVPKSLKKCL